MRPFLLNYLIKILTLKMLRVRLQIQPIIINEKFNLNTVFIVLKIRYYMNFIIQTLLQLKVF